MIKIFIADDHAIVRKGLKQIVSDTSDMVVDGEAANGHEALKKIRKNKYDVTVLDVSMPGMDGLDILKQLKIEKPNLPVLILSIHPEEQYAMRSLKAGASGYLTKESVPDELITAIRRIVRGGKYVSPTLAEKLASYLETDINKQLHETLSDREYQVMIMIAKGETITEIANELSLSVKTISTYRSRLLDKMKMKNNAKLTHYAIKHQLVD